MAEKLSLSVKQVNNVYDLHEGGATIPFMSRYRKEATGNLDEVQIGQVVEEVKYFSELAKRKETVSTTIDGLGKLTPELKARIDNCMNATELEDIYLPYKPKRKTRAVMAIEKGLEPLAQSIFHQGQVNPATLAEDFISDQVKDSAEALQGARDIVAEWVAEHEQARNAMRQLFTRSARLSSKILTSKKEEEEAQKYRDYFEFSEALSQSPSHRILAIRRGEKEGFLVMDIDVEKETAVELLNDIFVHDSNFREGRALNEACANEVKTAVADSFGRLLKPSIENEFRLLSKNKADEEAIRVFAENLRQLLLASPLGARRVLAIDPGFRSGCKVVCLDEQGTLLEYNAVFPHPPQSNLEGATATLKQMVQQHGIQAIGFGNGTASRETDQWVRSIDFGKTVNIFMVNESGASIYSASEVAREEFPDQDVTVRGAVSIGRRLLDPLSELVKIDPKSIGVGQYQHDVNPTQLKASLDAVVESCVNHVGVDLNTASRHLLTYVSGLGPKLAQNIVDYRKAHGAFATRDALKKVPLLGPRAYEQCAGFLRIRGAGNPLDNSAVHPESYPIVEAMAQSLNCSLADLIQKPELRKQIRVKDFITESAGTYTIEDILKELEKPGRDPRPPIEEFAFAEGIKTMEDLKPGMELPGMITNITQFGAFVDIGVKQDGLVHISHLSNRYVSDPSEVVKLQQKVKVTVLEVDIPRKRISLSMKGAAPAQQPQAPRPKQNNKPQSAPKKENDFKSSLEALKNRFK